MIFHKVEQRLLHGVKARRFPIWSRFFVSTIIIDVVINKKTLKCSFFKARLQHKRWLVIKWMSAIFQLGAPITPLLFEDFFLFEIGPTAQKT